MTNEHTKTHPGTTLEILEQILAESCDCKLREKCLDKSSPDCLKHRNLYAEAMINQTVTRLE
ncbi:MAG: hypothetical protein B7X95_07700 [Methylophilaceae bacterium 17-44-8]|jgi:hypothetical protein|nr:MAG: hypothetical protein B7Y48_05365 [Methylophilales bacterium 28-44-11]OZA05128.1 MAG: hypothetical protein B7X95_07700 [Methylophilaceae bacterium 17-44-8]